MTTKEEMLALAKEYEEAEAVEEREEEAQGQIEQARSALQIELEQGELAPFLFTYKVLGKEEETVTIHTNISCTKVLEAIRASRLMSVKTMWTKIRKDLEDDVLKPLIEEHAVTLYQIKISLETRRSLQSDPALILDNYDLVKVYLQHCATINDEPLTKEQVDIIYDNCNMNEVVIGLSKMLIIEGRDLGNLNLHLSKNSQLAQMEAELEAAIVQAQGNSLPES